MAHLHSIYDSDLHFVIDPVTRVITNQSANKNAVIQFDHNSERFTFELPRYIEEHDMLGCNRVEVHYVNIDSKTGTQVGGVYDVRDLQVSPHDNKVVICSWLVSNNATQYAGTLNFVIRFACTSGDVVDYVWNTAVFKNYAVQNGLYNSDPIVTQYPDVLAQWYDSLFTASADGVTNISEAKRAAITAVDAVADERIADIMQTGRNVVASLPADYVALAEDVAPPIVETATGAAIAVHDSANRKLRGLTLYGKSTQDGTPTPEAPVEIQSVENPTVRVCGKNLFDIKSLGVTLQDDGGYLLPSYPKKPMIVFTNGYAGQMTVSCWIKYESTDSRGGYIMVYYTDGTDDRVGVTNSSLDYQRYEFTTRADKVISEIDVSYGVGTVVTYFKDVQVEFGTTATVYEPYTEQTLPFTRTLPGIPVASGGNYTDENGQQWICDEVDFERGAYVQRIKSVTYDGADETWALNQLGSFARFTAARSDIKNGSERTGFLCTRFTSEDITNDRVGLCFIGTSTPGQFYFYPSVGITTVDQWKEWLAQNPITVCFALATPIETALTAEELAAYASLRSNYPNTSVLNGGGAGMAVAYVADTKLYIDKKLSV